MTDEDDNIVELADLSADVVRARNDDIDGELSAKEERIDDLESKVEEQKSKVASLKEERDAATELLEEFQQAEREAAKERLASALPDDAEFDDEKFESASVDQIQWMADVIEATRETNEKTASKSPDLSKVKGNGDVNSRKAEIANEMGMADAYEKAQSGGFDRPEGFEVGPDEEKAAKQEDLIDSLTEVMN